jgi:hypothetical protein
MTSAFAPRQELQAVLRQQLAEALGEASLTSESRNEADDPGRARGCAARPRR